MRSSVNLWSHNDQLSSFKVGSTLRCNVDNMITHNVVVKIVY